MHTGQYSSEKDILHLALIDPFCLKDVFAHEHGQNLFATTESISVQLGIY